MRHILIVLEPAGNIQPGNLRQLNVHDDQVRLLNSGNLHHPRAVAALECLVAKRIKQVAEQAHVQFIVFDDQDRFRGHIGHDVRSVPHGELILLTV